MASSSKPPIKFKNWLIRTKNRQILGPVTKEKLLEFVKKGALSPQDEVTSGNGYWFYINEKDLVDKYLFGDVPQTFNPISEAPSVLSIQVDKEHTGTINPGLKEDKRGTLTKSSKPVEQTALPSDDDLAYPDFDNFEFAETPRVDDDKAPDSTQIVQLDKKEEKREPVKSKERAPLSALDLDEETNLPCEEDLEYPE